MLYTSLGSFKLTLVHTADCHNFSEGEQTFGVSQEEEEEEEALQTQPGHQAIDAKVLIAILASWLVFLK